MTVKDIAENFKTLNICEQRAMADDYGEIIFFTADKNRWREALDGVFGPPVKPTGIKPSREDRLITMAHGEVRPHQALFKKEFGEYTVIGMLWPWKDGSHTTLKLFRLKTEEIKKNTGGFGSIFENITKLFFRK